MRRLNPKQKKFELSFFEDLRRELPGDISILKVLAELYTEHGKYHEGLAIDQFLAEVLPDDPSVHYNLACSYSLTGDVEQAAASLRQAIGNGWDNYHLMMRDPDLKALRTSPLFAEIQRLIGRKSDPEKGD
jgi:predicted Zn-dependent protease